MRVKLRTLLLVTVTFVLYLTKISFQARAQEDEADEEGDYYDDELLWMVSST